MELTLEAENRVTVAAVFEAQRRQLAELLGGGRIEHVGATAVPGSLTKGDLDVCAIVAAASFEAAVAILRSRYETHQLENWGPTYASFTAAVVSGVAIGVQLVAAGSDDQRLFLGWRDRLLAEPTLLRRYNELKRANESADPDRYRAAKAAFIDAELRRKSLGAA